MLEMAKERRFIQVDLGIKMNILGKCDKHIICNINEKAYQGTTHKSTTAKNHQKHE